MNWTLLISSILILAVGPLLHTLLRQRREWLHLLDGFNFVAISGLIFLSIIPETLIRGGPYVLFFALLGIVGPSILERRSHSLGKESHFLALILGLAGLCLHAVFDGAALISPEHPRSPEALHAAASAVHDHDHHHHHSHLPIAVILHRIPIGLTIWLLMKPKYGSTRAVLVLAAVAVMTTLGFLLGDHFLSGLPAPAMACFEALVAGSLIHVVLHKTQNGSSKTSPVAPGGLLRTSEGFGGIVGLVLLGWLLIEGGLLLEYEGLGHQIAHAFIDLSLESAPAILLGYLLSGILDGFLPAASVRWMGKGSRLGQSVRGMVLGLPLPVCSCGVVPLYRTLIQRGAPPTAAMAFMVATPELGLDAILLSFPLLGADMTFLRLGASALVALLVGYWVGGLTRRKEPDAGSVASTADPESESERPTSRQRLRRIFTFGLGELVDHTGPWILLGLATAALASPLLDPEWLRSLPGPLTVVGLALIGIPTYVCASGATPLVAVLIASGVSPGAALAFLLTGPATNVTTFGVIGRLHGRRTAILFSGVIILLAITLGLLVDAIFPGLTGAAAEEGHEHDHGSWLQWLCLGALALIYLISFLRNGPRKFFGEVVQTGHEHPPHEHPGAAGESHGAGCSH